MGWNNDTKASSTDVRRGSSPLKTDPSSKRLFTKTVTNFAQVRYDNNGGLNPVSPEKRGLGGLEMTTGTVSKDPNRDLRNSSTVFMARPSLELDISQRAVSVF